MITGNSDVSMAVEAMKAGALDFIEKPIGREELIASIERALELSQDSSKLQEWRAVGGDTSRGSDAATARGDGTGARRPSQQLADGLTLVHNGERSLRNRGDTAHRKLSQQGALVHLFQESGAKSVRDFEHGAEHALGQRGEIFFCVHSCP